MVGVLTAALLLCGCAAGGSSDSLDGFVDLAQRAPGIIVDIRYATADNFTKTALYPANRCLLRAEVAERLRRAQDALRKEGLGLKVWDCYRPLSIQKKLWALVPDPRYVADPRKGSRHNRGAAVDVTLVGADGSELEMPTGYDDFTGKAHRDSREASETALKNRGILEEAMAAQDLRGLRTEWWHFDAPDWRSYGVADAPLTPASP